MAFKTEYAMLVELHGPWPDLQTKLTGPDADRVGGCLQGYISTHYEKLNIKAAFERLKVEDNHVTYQEMRRTRIHEEVLMAELRTLVADQS